jgi:hypothetical protein
MLFLVRILLISIVLPALLGVAPPASVAEGAPSEREGLTAREAGALRKALYGLNTTYLRDGREEAILRETYLGTPTLSDAERARLKDHVWRHVPTIVATQELLNLRQRWRKRSVDLFVFWWHPAYRGVGGIPARSPTTLEAQHLEDVARAAGERLAVEPPAWMPYRIDPREETGRTYPRTDLRWGVSAPDSTATGSVVEAIARERGGVPGLWKPLGALLGTCHGDEACREDLLAGARASAGDAGLVPVLELLTAGTLGGIEDPAYATSLLFTDLVLGRESPEEIGALLDGLEPGLAPEEARRVLRAALGSTPERFDRRLAKELRDGRRDRLGRSGD